MELSFVRNESGNCTTVPGNKTVLALVSWCPEGKSWDLEAVLDPFCGEPCVRCIVRGVCVCACVCVLCVCLSNSVVSNWEQFCLPGDTWQCPETFLVVTVGRRGVATA